MTNIVLTIRLEDSGSSVEPIVGPGWRYRVRNSLPYVNGAGERVDASWGVDGSWKKFQSTPAVVDLDPLPPDNPYYLEVARPGDPTSADPAKRQPSIISEYRQVLATTPNNTSWWNLTQVSAPGPEGTEYPPPLKAYIDAAVASLQSQIAAISPPDGGASSLAGIGDMSDDARSFNAAVNFLAMRTLLLAAGLTTVDDLSVGDDATVNGDLAVSGTITNAGLTAALAGKADDADIPTWSTIGGKPTVVAAGADQAAARTAIGAAPLDSPALTGTPSAPTPAAGDNDTSIATTAFVQAALAAAGAVSITVDPTDPDILIVTVP